MFTSPSNLKNILKGSQVEEQETAADELAPKQDVNVASTSHDPSQAATADLTPKYKRTRSIKRVVEEAKAFLGTDTEDVLESNREGPSQSNVDALTTPTASIDTRTGKKRQRQTRGLLGSDTPNSTQRKKRITDLMIETEKNGDSLLETPHSRVSTPATKRYNFRQTTM